MSITPEGGLPFKGAVPSPPRHRAQTRSRWGSGVGGAGWLCRGVTGQFQGLPPRTRTLTSAQKRARTALPGPSPRGTPPQKARHPHKSRSSLGPPGSTQKPPPIHLSRGGVLQENNPGHGVAAPGNWGRRPSLVVPRPGERSPTDHRPRARTCRHPPHPHSPRPQRWRGTQIPVRAAAGRRRIKRGGADEGAWPAPPPGRSGPRGPLPAAEHTAAAQTSHSSPRPRGSVASTSAGFPSGPSKNQNSLLRGSPSPSGAAARRLRDGPPIRALCADQRAGCSLPRAPRAKDGGGGLLTSKNPRPGRSSLCGAWDGARTDVCSWAPSRSGPAGPGSARRRGRGRRSGGGGRGTFYPLF